MNWVGFWKIKDDEEDELYEMWMDRNILQEDELSRVLKGYGGKMLNKLHFEEWNCNQHSNCYKYIK